MHSLSIVLKVHELGRSVSKVYGEAGISEWSYFIWGMLSSFIIAEVIIKQIILVEKTFTCGEWLKILNLEWYFPIALIESSKIDMES